MKVSIALNGMEILKYDNTLSVDIDIIENNEVKSLDDSIREYRKAEIEKLVLNITK